MLGHTLRICIVGAVAEGLAGTLSGGFGAGAVWMAVGSIVGLLVGAFAGTCIRTARSALGGRAGSGAQTDRGHGFSSH